MSNNVAEYYFDYRIEKVFEIPDIKKEIAKPKLYFEYDYAASQYCLFAVPSEWIEKGDVQEYYDRVEVVFDINGVDCAPLSDKASAAFKKAEIKSRVPITLEKFRQDGCRIILDNSGASNHSGVGTIEMYRGDKLIAKYFFAINFSFRQKIAYTISIKKGKLYLQFKSSERPVGIQVNVIYNADRLPSLKNDARINVIGQPITLDFSAKDTYDYCLDLKAEGVPEGVYLSVMFDNQADEQFYLLDCVSNESLPQNKKSSAVSLGSYACPYCHRPIDAQVIKSKEYRRGGVSCRALTENQPEKSPKIIGKKLGLAQSCMYCADDLDKNDTTMFNDDFNRVLPPRYLEHDSFKIAFMGSTRAGKTTYISRFFGITGDKKISMPMTSIANSMAKMGVTVQPALVAQVNLADSENSTYQIQDNDWCDTKDEYRDRSINLNPPKYPQPTTESDYTKYPFIVEVNGDSYVSFYDIAGEVSKGSVAIKNIANNDLIGVFYIINGKKDELGNEAVRAMLEKSKLDPACPIAVIVTKMDMLEPDFDSNCQCLRTDYLESMRTYENSNLEQYINQSSEEIRSYLLKERLLPNNIEGIYSNIKYFGVSSFTFLDSVHSEKDDVNDPGELKFVCSSKHLELPFVWMLKQFGAIK